MHQSQNQISNSWNSLKFSRTPKPKIDKNSLISWSIFESLFAANSSHHHLHLFLKFGLKGASIRSCARLHHSWQIKISCTRSGIDRTWAYHSPPWSLLCICFGPTSRETPKSTLSSRLRSEFEFHVSSIGYMRSIVCWV
jgi:hypothetical protein